jgi:predicted GNAT superfamily acetyltransferase
MKGVRPLALSDCEETLRINSESLPGVVRLDSTEFERLLALPNHHLALDRPEGGLRGYLLAFASDVSYDGAEFLEFVETVQGSFIYIDQVAVGAEYRRTGVASEFYGALEKWARNSTIAHLCCEVNLSPANPASLAFHLNQGFNQTSTLDAPDGRMVALMIKHLIHAETGARET